MGIWDKTTFLWLHKFRQEATDHMAEMTLGGEIEFDGGYFGGYCRAKNVKKERTDLRKIPYRDAEREMSVTFAVERNGAVRAWVAKREGHPKKQMDRAFAKDAVLFSDSAPSWNSFRGKRRLFQVNHNVAYMTPEACTNAAESAVRSLRAAEDVHRHIAQTYLDLYAGEAGWRVTYNHQRRGKEQRFATLMAMMSRPGRSALAGYFQGKKRLCRIVSETGEWATWRPPTREERDRARAARDKAPIGGPYRPRRTPATWSAGFQFVPAAQFAQDWSVVRDLPGVYVLLLRDGAITLPDDAVNDLPLWRRGGFVHVYTGESYGLRGRVREHLTGSLERSSLRESLLALRWSIGPAFGGIEVGPDRSSAEDKLTEWLLANALVGHKQSAHIRDYERDVLNFVASPLNTRRDQPTEFARKLREARALFREEVTSRWVPPERTFKGTPRR